MRSTLNTGPNFRDHLFAQRPFEKVHCETLDRYAAEQYSFAASQHKLVSSKAVMVGSIRIAVVEQNRDRALMIIDGLRETGDHIVRVFGDETGLEKKLAAFGPDLVLVDVTAPSRDTLEELTLASRPDQRPVAIFVDNSDEQMMRSAIDAGVSVYVVDGLSQDRVKSILGVAIARFNSFSRMRNELEATKRALADRKTVDRAKGLLMKARGLNEEEAYALLRKSAMDQGRKVIDVAHALVTAADLLT